MVAAMAMGLAYVAWLAWAEGWRLWVVLGIMSLVGAIGGAVHLAMGLARQREGLDEAGDGAVGGESPPEQEKAASDPRDSP